MQIDSAKSIAAATALGLAACIAVPGSAWAHAVVGDRVFPATLTIDDPGVGDEFDTQFGHIATPDGNGGQVNVNTVSYEWDKLITQNLALIMAGSYVSQNSADGSVKGWDNFTFGAKYLFYTNPAHEIMASGALLTTPGGTGSKAIGAPYSSFTPEFDFGKGFGDLPAPLAFLRPLAFTASIGPNLTTASSAEGPNSFGWGMTLQYSLPYLQNQVRDLGLPRPFRDMYLVVEAPMSTCTAGACAGQTTGTINPGVLWVTRFGQLGIEAQIPVNHLSGSRTGVLLDAHLYFDDIFPHSLGKPIF
jgi:hypothetical protein